MRLRQFELHTNKVRVLQLTEPYQKKFRWLSDQIGLNHVSYKIKSPKKRGPQFDQVEN